ncbi:hypothetical protein [Chengkuizengella axinellae]|uniref:UDP-N-acetylmuramyl pentapeptide phosphotransferase n=1 Tax=Chengkuizengella axinellae TaxID=3064388 RepID=A0ABT9IW87_9BACL|nr:hypothetical protein [Chengkuizengella sp. 2205SS18-9]MDP5273621.1 hypothetical protein [Chengkuizengella sp. 2205SS18-9]
MISIMTFFGFLLLEVIIYFLVKQNIVAENYLHHKIPIGLGLFLWLLLIIYYAFLQWMIPSYDFLQTYLPQYIMILTLLFIVGWLDDRVGDPKVKGLKGHFMKLIKERRLTTGSLKAFITAALSIWVLLRIMNNHPLLEVIQFFILTLMTNGVNLLDLRPGRALKFFLLLSCGILFLSSLQQYFIFLLPMVLGVLLLLKKDIGGEVMLGDSGSNLLGFVLGFCIILMTPWWVQIFCFIFLLHMHWISERDSITNWIETKPLIHWIDQWGRV